MEGLDQKSECEYGKQIGILLENKTDQWEKVILDGKEQKLEHHKITWKELAPGKHVLHLKAVDQAGNKTDQRITFKITKVLPKVKQIVVKNIGEQSLLAENILLKISLQKIISML